MLVGAAVLVLVGCTAQVDVEIGIKGPDDARVRVGAVFTDEAAEVLQDGPDVLDELVGVFSDRGATEMKTVDSQDRVEVWGTVPHAEVVDAGGLTGVAGVTLSDLGEGVVSAFVELQDAGALVGVLENAVAQQPDSGAMLSTMSRSTVLRVVVDFPGGLVDDPAVVGVGKDSVEVGDRRVVISRTVDEAGTGGVTVVGRPDAGLPWGLIGLVGGVGLVGFVIWGAWRRDRVAPLDLA